ncbi:DNA-3-methyladenine glycosylase [Blastococcus sp. TF02A-30]|uniref:DNA-3-methyladenine glycosylase n=1 Tax=Blastococcus sp. TF02A-30 TaxID=2250580 RepID=UPI003519F2D8
MGVGVPGGGGPLSAPHDPSRPSEPGPLVRGEDLLGRPDAVAPSLLGCWLVTDRPEGSVALRLTEVEAYSGSGEDPSAHSHRGPTPRAAIMFGPPGRLYVYFSYGVHWCANVVVGPEGEGSAVLLRAGEVVLGSDLARSRRPSARTPRDLAGGPARLTQALAIGREDLGTDLLDPASPVRLHRGTAPAAVSAGPRVGISVATELPWRFWETGAPSVSVFRAGGKQRRRPGGQDGSP